MLTLGKYFDKQAIDPLQLFISCLIKNSGAANDNQKRASYAPWFKHAVYECISQGMTYKELARYTGISIDTLKKFKSQISDMPEKQPIDGKSMELAEIWRQCPPEHKKTLDAFTVHLSRTRSDLSFSRDELRETLKNLALRYPRGPSIENHGTRVKRKFEAHALCEGDGKWVKIEINGMPFSFCWYAFIDQGVTLLVGGNVDHSETALSFLEALKAGEQKAGFLPIGIVIDNRFKENDLGSVQQFCAGHNIEIVRIFPGNSKSNGTIEGNFSIFEKFVGEIKIEGKTALEIAKSIAQAFIEVFTQQRNHSGRKKLEGESPEEYSKGATKPEHARTAIERLASRLHSEELRREEKWALIQDSARHFGALFQPDVEKMKKQLEKFPIEDIIAAQAAYMAQINTHPDKRYGSEYFFAILRYKREEKAKRTYNEAYKASIELSQILLPSPISKMSLEEMSLNMLEELERCVKSTTPTQAMLGLDSVCLWMANHSREIPLPDLWKNIGDLAERYRGISSRQWGFINEYVADLIGCLLFPLVECMDLRLKDLTNSVSMPMLDS